MKEETKLVCPACGGELSMIDTVDNSDNPTKWRGCLKCQQFCGGVTQEQFNIARELVEKKISVPYSEQVVPHDRTDWLESQTKGNQYLVAYISQLIAQTEEKTNQMWREKIKHAKKRAKCRIGKGDPESALTAGTRLGIFQADQRAQKEFDALLSESTKENI